MQSLSSAPPVFYATDYTEHTVGFYPCDPCDPCDPWRVVRVIRGSDLWP